MKIAIFGGFQAKHWSIKRLTRGKMPGANLHIFYRGRFWDCFWVPGSMLVCFSAFLLLCFSAFLLFCFSCFLLFLLLCFWCFSAFPASVLFWFCASVPSTSTILRFSFLQSCILLLYFLLLCFSASCLYYLFVFSFLFFCFIPSCLFLNETLKTLGET